VQMPIFLQIRADRRPRALEARAGYSLIEILVVLAIMGLSTAVIMPSTSRMMDQATSHAVFFEFQREVSELRREANRTGLPLRLVDPVAPQPSDSDDGMTRRIELRRPWSYTLAPSLDIQDGGRCSVSTANLVRDSTVIMTLRTTEGDCRFIRYAGS